MKDRVMEYSIFKADSFQTSAWTGGKTTELAIFPETSSYVERNFTWRLSTAVCEQEETTFSKLPGFDRVLLVLEGNVVLAHQDVRVSRLSAMEQDRFDGAYLTKSFGKITDYNLMVAKGNLGFLDILPLTEESGHFIGESHPSYNCQATTLYLKEGYAAISIHGKTEMLKAGDQMVIRAYGDEEIGFSAMGEGELIRGQIFYHYQAEETEPTVIPARKGTFEDYKTCVYLANTQFRGARFIFRKLNTIWFDEELSRAIKKIEGLFLPFILCFAGFFGLALWGVSADWEPIQWISTFAGWLLIDIFLISPLMYFAVVPKPTKAHIKDIDKLTPYEQKVRERQMNTNEQVEKILKKYKNSGRNLEE